ncbi:MAG TPA: chromosome segregation protein SMC [Gammaproteobacteria bacterium]|nr:chromosome segregation protein SMC [Gammaproteobacteria bacterium]
MKLKQIKLAGFKSFVDPTVLDLRSDLVGVVGPNGCGKSNVIDAVRWVMGESSAKTLRGESITDVIFNGSNTRKPIGQASIELIFDNTDGSIGGEYAAYAEISVRREVSRDAVSNYFLNGTKCRRRDIVDVFLGTGLGARSYSIIEQGMISRIIESKPEDLRTFVEEAAGISVYKKRRHDTELRMRHTTENLSRLEDLREEQIKLLERLQRQAESAQKYQSYNTAKNLLEAQLLGLRWQNYDSKLASFAEQISSLSLNLEEKQTARTTIGADLERVRVAHADQADKHEEVQSKFYELGAVVARTEQSLQYHKERKVQLSADIEQVKQTIVEITAQKTTDSDALFDCEEQLASITPEHQQVTAAAEQAEEIYLDARANLDAANAEWEEYQQQSQIPQQQAEVQRSRIEQMDKQARDLQNRIEKLQQEKASLDVDQMHETVADLQTQMIILETQNSDLKLAIGNMQQAISQQRTDLAHRQDEQNNVRSRLQQAKGREASLQELQQAAMGKDDKVKRAWLEKHNLYNMPRLAEQLKVAPGWEQAVETVLGHCLEAVCVDAKLDDLVSAINDLGNGNITLVDNYAVPTVDANNGAALATKVHGSSAVAGLLEHILIAETLADALSLRAQLKSYQSVVTKDGIWLGTNWLRIMREKDSKRGILQRENDLQEIRAELTKLEAQAAQLEEMIATANANLHELEVTLSSKLQIEAENAANLRDISTKHSAAQQKLEHMRNRRQRIDVEIGEQQQNSQLTGEEATLARNTLEQAIEAMAGFARRKEQITNNREQCIQREKTAKQTAKELQDNMHSLEIALQTVTTKYQGLQHTISRVDQQLGDLHKRHQQLQQSLQDDVEPEQLLLAELDTLLAQRVAIEAQLQQARAELDVYAAQMKQQEQQRAELEQAAIDIKDILDQCKLERQTLQVRKETIDEQLQIGNIDLKEILANLPQEAEEEAWQEQIETLAKKINNLGAVNLAAAQELETETQRQQYLEVQYTDLKEALTTLENAIKKIDRETKSKFHETFTQINANFSALFPKLFGGGKAYLEVVGEDLLEAGVTVMAMPPGKKNSTIHLLSGGEKALTAVALVFSIFQLNPAPFCMLDEVDAPLDESNVVRFGNLIKEMSQHVQFILITHNKTTMEIANQLIGVTMKEPGVSRLVSVDINEAVEMALA